MTLTHRTTLSWLIVLTCAVTSALAEPVTFFMSSKQKLRLGDGYDAEAKIYASVSTPRVVILSPQLEQPLLLIGGEKTVTPLDAAKIQPAEEPDAIIAETTPAGPTTSFAIEGTKISFAIGAKRFVLERVPLVITGELARAKILEALPEYRRVMRQYSPVKGDMRLLETSSSPVQVEVFFGTWCPHCEQYVPRLLRVVEELKATALTFSFHGVPEKFTEDPIARQYGIEAIPLAIVKRGDKIVARIEGNAWTRPEQALSAVLFGEESLATAPATKP